MEGVETEEAQEEGVDLGVQGHSVLVLGDHLWGEGRPGRHRESVGPGRQLGVGQGTGRVPGEIHHAGQCGGIRGGLETRVPQQDPPQVGGERSHAEKDDQGPGDPDQCRSPLLVPMSSQSLQHQAKPSGSRREMVCSSIVMDPLNGGNPVSQSCW